MVSSTLDALLKKAIPGRSSNTEQANEILRQHVLWATGAGLVPIPVLDIAAVTGVQLDMVNRLARVYHVDYTESLGKSLLSALAGSSLARLGASGLKFIPVVGTALGVVSMSALSGAATYAVGMVFIHHFESGGTLEDFNINSYRNAYEGYFQKGKEAIKNTPSTDTAQAKDAYTRLEQLNKLREKGVVTEEEFQAKKKQLLLEL